jgi:hypothetical protein
VKVSADSYRDTQKYTKNIQSYTKEDIHFFVLLCAVSALVVQNSACIRRTPAADYVCSLSLDCEE